MSTAERTIFHFRPLGDGRWKVSAPGRVVVVKGGDRFDEQDALEALGPPPPVPTDPVDGSPDVAKDDYTHSGAAGPLAADETPVAFFGAAGPPPQGVVQGLRPAADGER